MYLNAPVTAGQAGRCLSLSYNGFARLVEVHAVGVTRAGNRVMRVWQVSGGSSSGKPVGWKLMSIGEASNMAISEQIAQVPRERYRRGDKAMARIDWQV